jgi:hypothetical protein
MVVCFVRKKAEALSTEDSKAFQRRQQVLHHGGICSPMQLHKRRFQCVSSRGRDCRCRCKCDITGRDTLAYLLVELHENKNALAACNELPLILKIIWLTLRRCPCSWKH